MLKGQKSFRSIVIASILIVATTITATASWTDYINPFAFFALDSTAADRGLTEPTTEHSQLTVPYFVGETAFQDFGVASGSNTSQTGSTILIPAPTGSGAGSATTYARGGATAPAAPIFIENTANPLGSTGSFLRAVASASTSVAKASPFVSYTGSPENYTSFKAMFGTSTGAATATSGSWTFSQGTGAVYSDNNAFSSSQVFGALRFTYASGGVVNLTYNNGSGSFVTTSLTTTAFAQGVPHTVELVGNNKTSGTINYTYNGFSRSVAVQRLDLYIDGILIGDDLTVGGGSTIAAGANINSAMFTGISSTGNVANLFIDDVATFSTVPAAISTSKISTFPYSETFESGNGGYFPWVTSGSVNNWILGTPAKTQITGAHGGTKAWVTNLTTNYSASHNVSVSSPVFDLTGKPDPTLSFWSNFRTEADWDAMILEMSINGGGTWTKVDANLGTGGTFNTTNSTGWYNNNSASGPITPPKWSTTSTAYTGHSSGWIQSTTVLTGAGGQSDVRLRWRFGSDGIGQDEGVAIDDISMTVPVGPGTVQFSATSYTDLEGNTATITVNRTGGSSGAISVDYATGGGTATGGASCTTGVDYITPTPGTFNWADTDAAAKTFNVQLCTDNDVETESLNLTLSNPVGTTITGTNPVSLNITDNPPGTIQFSSTTYAGDEGLVAVVTATRTSGTGGAVSVNYATSDGTATSGVCGSGGDYVAASGSLNWANGESTSKTFNVTLCSDLLTSEGAETVNLTLSSPTGGATIGASNPAVLTINDAGIVFCNSDGITIPLTSGTGPFPSTPYPSVVAVSGLVGTTNTVKVKLNTITHTWGPDIDILLVSPSGQKFVLMSDVGDSAGLDTAVNLTFVDGGTTIPASGAIASGSYAPRDLEASDVFATGAPAGPYSSPATVGAATLNGTFGGLNPNGNWSLYVSDDTGGDGGSIASWCLEFTLNPPTPGTVQFSPAAYTPNENTVQTITATRTGGTAGAVSVDYATGGGTATSGTCGTNDYVAATGALNWADGESGAKTFNVTICPDAVLDPGETFEATLSNPTGGVTIGGTNPAVVTITDVPPPFSGTYTVGSGGNYPSLTNTGGIFEAINLSGATGNVTIQIISNLTGELGTHALNEIAGGFSTLIYPCGNPISITGSNTGALIRLNGADNVTIFGDSVLCNPPLVGGEPARRHLTIQNTNTGLATSVILIASNGANGAQNNLIQHVNVLGQDPTTTLYGISLGGATPGSVATGPNNDNKVINNSIKRAHIGVYSAGQVATPNTGTEIRENETSAVTGDRIRRVGIVVRNDNGAQILDNSINGINNTGESFDAIGIGVGTEDVNTTATTSGNVSNALVARNRVNGVSNDTTFSAAGIAVAGGTLGANTIVNNMVSGIISDATTPDIPTGIWVAGVTGSNTILYHNSVSMTGDRSALTTPGTSQLPSYGIAITGVDPTVEMKNNIFYTTQTAEAVANPGALSYAIGMVSTTFTNLDSDSNDFWSAGPRDGGFRTGSLASAAGTSHVDLSAWQVAITNDATSQEADPVFINPANDLHLDALTTPLLGDGQGGETFDHDGDPRPAANTDVGADEVVQSVGGSFPAGTYYNGATADGDVLSGNVTFTNALTLNGILTTIVPDPPNSDIVYVVTLGCGVTSVGNASTSNYIVGSVNKQYCGPANFTYPVGSGGFYSPANVDVTAVGVNPSSLTVRPHDALLVGFNPLETLTRNWQLDEVGDITANLLFYYDESDVVGNESDYRIWRRESNGTDTNMCSGGPCVDTVNNILGPVNGVTTFSRWTGSGPLAPTSSAASVSGRVVTANGQGIRGAAIVITGNSLPTPIIVKTGSLGYFQADNLDTGQTYVVTVVSKRFTFSQPSRVINLADNINDVDFMANPLE